MEDQIKIFIESIKLVAWSYENQVKHLPDFVDVEDDVIAGFENAFLLLPQLVESNLISNKSTAKFLRLNNKIDWCIMNIGLYDFSNNEWDNVREMAKEVLIELNISDFTPDPDFL